MGLTVRLAVARRHRTAGCTPERDSEVRQVPAAAFPRRRLAALAVRALPLVTVRDRPSINQDAGKGATLRYRATAQRSRPRRRARRAARRAS